MAKALECVGGPLDGHRIVKAPGTYSWIRGAVSTVASLRVLGRLRALPGARPLFLHGGAASSRPRDGAALYEHDAGAGVLLYAGHRVTLCNACGSYHGKCEGGSEKRRCALGGDP